MVYRGGVYSSFCPISFLLRAYSTAPSSDKAPRSLPVGIGSAKLPLSNAKCRKYHLLSKKIFRTGIFSLVLRKNVARKLFGFGPGSKKFSRGNEKILAPLFGETRATIGAFLVRISKTAGCAPSDNGDVLTPPFHSLRQQTSPTPHILLPHPTGSIM